MPIVQPKPREKRFSERPGAYVLAVLGGFLGGPLGVVASPLVLFGINRLPAKAEPGFPRMAVWALAGIIGVPICIGITAPFLPNTKKASAPKTEQPQKQVSESAADRYVAFRKECADNMKKIEASGYTKSAAQLGLRPACSEAEVLRETLSGINSSTASGAHSFLSAEQKADLCSYLGPQECASLPGLGQ